MWGEEKARRRGGGGGGVATPMFGTHFTYSCLTGGSLNALNFESEGQGSSPPCLDQKFSNRYNLFHTQNSVVILPYFTAVCMVLEIVFLPIASLVLAGVLAKSDINNNEQT
uniref:Uncharacterized protein n=1 Tax=Cacopsylla melanoneura TaxID=428564 RepID=A0A8D8QHT5_9HEMI